MKLQRTSRYAALALASTLVLAACGGDDDDAASTSTSSGDTGSSSAPAEGTVGDLSGTLVGIGASSQAAAMQAWQAGFQEANPDVTVNYDPQGSGSGREQFLAGAAQFAGSDAYLDEEELTQATERCAGTGAVDLPHYISPIAVAFNLEGVESLNMKPATIAGVFAGTITNWNAPEIAADNPDATLPDLPIAPVHRSDESGTTENFTEYLSAAAGDVWTEEPSGDWPGSLGGEAAQGTSGVVSAIQAGNGAIGYADASQVAAAELGTVAVGVGGEFVEYSADAAAKIVEVSEPAADRPEGDLAIDLARDTTEAGTYPIVLVSYHIACKKYETAEEADLVKGFLRYVVSEEGQQAAATSAGSAPISDSLREQSLATIETITGG